MGITVHFEGKLKDESSFLEMFEFVEIIDEGEFFETNDLALLNKHLQACNEQLEYYLEQSEKYYGPVKLENGRIVDLMEQ